MTGTDEVFGRMLRSLREEAHLHQKELAQRMQGRGFAWYQATVARTEVADRPVRLGEALALAEILGVTLAEMTDEAAGRSALLRVAGTRIRSAVAGAC